MPEDLSKLDWEKFGMFIFGIIPGGAAVLVYQASQPELLHRVFGQPDLGYRTKLCAFIGCTLVIGFMIRVALMSILFPFVIKPIIFFCRERRELSAPWRDPRFREALKMRLPEFAPEDCPRISDAEFESMKAASNSIANPEERATAIQVNEQTRTRSEQIDKDWKKWYEHYSREFQTKNEIFDFQILIKISLASNIFVASVYVLISMCFVSALRTWWCILLCLFGVYCEIISVLDYQTSGFIAGPTLTRVIERLSSPRGSDGP
jgi:hypothetical protein